MVAGADNAAAELVEEAVTAFVAASAAPADLAAAILRVHARRAWSCASSTAAWFDAQRPPAVARARRWSASWRAYATATALSRATRLRSTQVSLRNAASKLPGASRALAATSR